MPATTLVLAYQRRSAGIRMPAQTCSSSSAAPSYRSHSRRSTGGSRPRRRARRQPICRVRRRSRGSRHRATSADRAAADVATPTSRHGLAVPPPHTTAASVAASTVEAHDGLGLTLHEDRCPRPPVATPRSSVSPRPCASTDRHTSEPRRGFHCRTLERSSSRECPLVVPPIPCLALGSGSYKRL